MYGKFLLVTTLLSVAYFTILFLADKKDGLRISKIDIIGASGFVTLLAVATVVCLMMGACGGGSHNGMPDASPDVALTGGSSGSSGHNTGGSGGTTGSGGSGAGGSAGSGGTAGLHDASVDTSSDTGADAEAADPRCAWWGIGDFDENYNYACCSDADATCMTLWGTHYCRCPSDARCIPNGIEGPGARAYRCFR